MANLSLLASGCIPLDALLRGGLEPDATTLVFGEPASGKTNFALQCAKAVIQEGKRVAYVDTEGLSAIRLEQVFGDVPTERLLRFNPFSIHEQEKMVQKTTLLQDLGLIVVDSINMHYRLHIDGDDTEKQAARSLYAQLHHLTNYARRNNVPVLITGQVYGIESQTQPFARRIMEHLVKILLRFEKRSDGTRKATLLKHRSIPEGQQALFKIGANGLEPQRREPKVAVEPDDFVPVADLPPLKREATETRAGEPATGDGNAPEPEPLAATGEATNEAQPPSAYPQQPPDFVARAASNFDEDAPHQDFGYGVEQQSPAESDVPAAKPVEPTTKPPTQAAAPEMDESPLVANSPVEETGFVSAADLPPEQSVQKPLDKAKDEDSPQQ